MTIWTYTNILRATDQAAVHKRAKSRRRGIHPWAARWRTWGLALLALSLVALHWGPALIGLFLENLANVHLAQALLPIPGGFHHSDAPEARQHLLTARRVAAQGWQFAPGSARIGATLLEANLALRDWVAARAWLSFAPHLQARAPGTWNGDLALLQGIEQLEQGQLEQGRALLHEGLTRTGGIVVPSLLPWLQQVAPQPSVDERPWQTLERTLQAGATPAPTYRVGGRVNGRWVAQPQVVTGGWTLVGYDLCVTDLEQSLPLETVLYWQPLAEALAPPADWVPVGELWAQRTTLLNLVANAGFEWGTEPGSAAPLGFGADAYGSPDTHGLLAVERNGRITYAGALLPSPEGRSANLAVAPIPVEPGQVHLQAAWVRSTGHLSLGRQWLGLSDRPDAPNYSYLVEGLRSDTWRYVAGIVQAPPQATGVHLMLLNWKSPGEVLFDELLFAALPLPEAQAVSDTNQR